MCNQSTSLKPGLVTLLFDAGSPLVTRPGFDQLESVVLVQMPGRLESVKGMEENLVIALLSTEIHRQVDQVGTDPSAANFVGGNEPAQVSPIAICIDAIDRNRGLDLSINDDAPGAVPGIVIAMMNSLISVATLVSKNAVKPQC